LIFGIELSPGIAFITRLPYRMVVQPHEDSLRALEVGVLRDMAVKLKLLDHRQHGAECKQFKYKQTDCLMDNLALSWLRYKRRTP
jgi:hypothetical protein